METGEKQAQIALHDLDSSDFCHAPSLQTDPGFCQTEFFGCCAFFRPCDLLIFEGATCDSQPV